MGWTALECRNRPEAGQLSRQCPHDEHLIERLNWRAEELRGKAPGPPNAAGPTTFDHET
jgi:hypothetical protein